MTAKAPPKKPAPVSDAELARLRARAAAARERLKHKPGREELLTAEEQANGAPFYFELRTFIARLKAAREAAGFTLAQVAEKTTLAEETLCRLESGAVTNPTWRTLGLYAAAVNCDVVLSLTSK